MRTFAVMCLTVLLAAPAGAQKSMDADPLMESNRALYETVKGYILAAAEQMPEADYAFRPTDEVRSFGEIIGHIADAHYLFCSAALQEENPNGENIEESRTSKAELVEALRASVEYCDRVYEEISDAQLAEPATVFGQERNLLFPVAFNITHDDHHYGNLVTYMRLNGMVPPSSQPSS